MSGESINHLDNGYLGKTKKSRQIGVTSHKKHGSSHAFFHLNLLPSHGKRSCPLEMPIFHVIVRPGVFDAAEHDEKKREA
jgi:hypothetical protein